MLSEQTANLVHQPCSTCDDALPDTMDRLYFQLFRRLWWHKAHRWATDSLTNGLCIVAIILVRFHIRFHELW
ncbi:hypothetical protein P775_11480 [Puniceibacterium antarcticum]|uniref:Uncharacterized protein n=1 Tax=Puniceibacterium antarcticum TaxID=1206336 RepID=A0A2G8RES6_9RHOB|nr:hypothetical protein P775_11480 [Puniceibacterium antarcticum]